jgi:hypothetical protein
LKEFKSLINEQVREVSFELKDVQNTIQEHDKEVSEKVDRLVSRILSERM